MSYLKLLTCLASIAIVTSGCGDDGKKESLSDKKYIVILQDVPSGICESELYRSTLENYGFQDVLTKETSNDTNCETYGKTNDGQYCAIAEYDAGDVNCVVGFNGYSGSYDELSFRKTNSASVESNDLDIATTTLQEAMQKLQK